MEQVIHLRESIEPLIATLGEALVWASAADPIEAVHDVRVATRRLRTFARLFAPLIGDKRARKLERRLRALTRALGPVREQDVLALGLRAEHATAEPLARAALEHVMAWAGTQHRKAGRRADEVLGQVDAAALAADLEAELDRVCGRMLRRGEQLRQDAIDWLEPELAHAFEGLPELRLGASQDGPVAGDVHEGPLAEDLDALHDARIRAKRLRYAIELLEPSLPKAHRSLRSPLKRIQSAVGDHRDAAQLTECLRRRRAALVDQGLHTLASALEPVQAAATHRRKRALEHAMQALAGLPGYDRVRRPAGPPS
jgi:CHAD domain-containing protein